MLSVGPGGLSSRASVVDARSFGVTLVPGNVDVQNSSICVLRLGPSELMRPVLKHEQTVVMTTVGVGADAGAGGSKPSS